MSLAPGPRESMGVARKSSIREVGGVDPRPVKDKAFVGQNIRILVNFLTDHNYDSAINPRSLTHPTVKDFANIVQFLFRKIDPNFVITGKFEDEVIQMFKVLGYPFSISKTALVAVGSPHSWPTLLAALVWVIELLVVDDQLAQAEEAYEASHEDIMSDEKAFFNYLSRAYKFFLSGDDQTCLQIVEEYVMNFEARNQELTTEIERVAEENEAIARQIQAIENQRSYLPELQKKKSDYEKDLEKFQQLIAQLQSHKDNMLQKVEARKTEVEKLRNTIANVENDIAALRERIAAQELSAEDVERMMQERRRVSEAMHQASEQHSIAQRKAWEAETELNRVLENVSKLAQEYNNAAEEMQLVPITAKNARGANYEITLNDQMHEAGRSSNKILNTKVQEKLLSMLAALKEQFAEASNAVRQQITTKSDEHEELETEVRYKQEELNMLEAKLRRLEENHRREKDVQHNLMGSQNGELSDLEARLAEIRDTSEVESLLTANNRKIVEYKSRLVVQREEHARVKNQLINAIMEVAAKCADHKEHVSQRLGEVQEKFRQQLEGLLMGGHIAAGKRRQASERSSVDDTFGLDQSWQEPRAQHPVAVSDIGVGMSPIPAGRHGYDDNESRFDHGDDSMAAAAMDLSRVVPEPRLRAVRNLTDVIDQASEDHKPAQRRMSSRRRSKVSTGAGM